MASPEPEPEWWPDGADEELVRECTCSWCTALLDALEDERDGVAIDGEHATIESFVDGGVA